MRKVLSLLFCASSLFAVDAGASPPAGAETEAIEGAVSTEPELPGNWRFRDADRPVKVVLLAGSVGAWQKDPYIKRFEQMCPRVEAKNLSKVGMGAWALKKRFIKQVLENRRLNFAEPNTEYWLVFHGGLNSVAMPEKTNRFISDIFVLAHRRGMGVVGLSLTPWGDASDGKRWRKAPDALRYFNDTKKIVDFIAGRSTPTEALGYQESERDAPGTPWSERELADVGIDLYDSPLRNHEAPMRDLAKVERELMADRSWRKELEAQPEASREAWKQAQIRLAAELPRWWLREELRSFDHIHPNVDGHAQIAELACPQLPESWGCSCPPNGAVRAASDAKGPDAKRPYM